MYRPLFAAAFLVATLSAQKTPTPPPAVQTAAGAVLRDLKELTGATFSSWYPLYAPMTDRVAFWEGRISTPTSPQSGYAIFRADGYLAEFNTKGAPATSKILSLIDGRNVRISRFGPHYLAVLDSRGGRAMEDGIFPRLIIDNVTGMPFPADVLIGSTRDGDKFVPKEFNTWRIRPYATEDNAFVDYVANYDKWFEYPAIPPSKPFNNVNYLMNPDPNSPTNGGAVTDGATQNSSEEFGLAQIGWRRWRQLEKDDPLNTNQGFASGCGGQAFLTLFNYHHINRKGGTSLLLGDPSKDDYAPTLIAMYLNNLRDWLGTFESFKDQGATFPWNMTEGVDYARFALNHYSDWVMATNIPGQTNILAGKMARDMVAIYGKPVIIGYLSDIHYDVVNRVRTVNGKRQFHIEFSDGKWINEDDIFFAAGAFDFRRVDNAAGYNHGFEHGFNGWHYDVNGKGSITPILRTDDATQGSAYASMTAANNNTARLWKRVDIGSTAATHFILTVQVQVLGPTTVTVQARDPQGQPATSLPNGPILASEVVHYNDRLWKEISFEVPKTSAFDFEVSFTSTAGLTVTANVDNLQVRPVFKQQPPAKQPCIMGKPGLDEGCDAN